MTKMKSKRWVDALSDPIALVNEVLSMLMFRVAPNLAKVRHIVAFQDGAQEKEIIIVGTVHYLHLKCRQYPLWDLKSVIYSVQPDLVLVEMRSSSIHSGDLGEGPIEMPFCMFVAREIGIEVRGIDDWCTAPSRREDNICANLISEAACAHRTLVFVGYSHVYGLVRRLLARGYRKMQLSRKSMYGLLKKPVAHSFPNGLAGAYRAAAEAAMNGNNSYDQAWANNRCKLAAEIAAHQSEND